MTYTTMEEEFGDVWVKVKDTGESGCPVFERRNREIQSFITTEIERAKREEHQFFLNVLDGIDIADREIGVQGGTKAIRFALNSRYVGAPDLSDCHYCNRFPFREHDCRNKRATLSDKE